MGLIHSLGSDCRHEVHFRLCSADRFHPRLLPPALGDENVSTSLVFSLVTLLSAAPLTQRAVEMVALPGGERILGIRLDDGRSPDGKMLLRRAWLKQHSPQLFSRFTAEEADQQRAALEQLRERVLTWQQKRQDDKQLARYIRRQLESIEKQLAAPDEKQAHDGELPDLLLVTFPRAQIRQQQVLGPARRQLLALAWQHHLDEPESQSAVDLTARLKEKQVDPAKSQADLADRIPSQQLSDRQWAAKVALTEFSVLGTPHYQGTGSFLTRADDGGGQADLTELLGGMLGGQLQELLNPDAKPAAPRNAADGATKEADAAGMVGLRVTQVDQQAESGKVSVRGSFLAKMPDGGWREIWSHTESASAGQAAADDVQEIKNDPQIGEILGKLKELGFDGNGLLERALKHGAATMAAQREVNNRFKVFLLRATRRLDGPTGWSE